MSASIRYTCSSLLNAFCPLVDLSLMHGACSILCNIQRWISAENALRRAVPRWCNRWVERPYFYPRCSLLCDWTMECCARLATRHTLRKCVARERHSLVFTAQFHLRITRHFFHQYWYTCPTALPVRQNSQAYKCFDCCFSYFRTSVSTSWSSCEPLYATNTSNRKQETFIYYECPLHRVLLPTGNAKQNSAIR
jgi:hypothetical protein